MLNKIKLFTTLTPYPEAKCEKRYLAGFLACSGLKSLPIRQKPDSGKSRFKLFW